MQGSEARLPDPMKFEGNLASNFKKFKQQFEIYMTATQKDKKATEVKVAILLNMLGTEGIEIYNNLDLSEENKNKYDEVIKAFEVYVNPRKNIIYERFVFNKRVQQENEPFDQFVQDLKLLVKSCEYDNQEDDIVRDRIVLGINDSKLQEKFIGMENLTLKKAIEMGRTNEITKNQVKDIQDREKVDVIRKNRFSKEKEENKGEKLFDCSKCGNRHGVRQCPAYGKKCLQCGLMNHFRKCCRLKNRRVTEVEAEQFDEDASDLMIGTLNVTHQGIMELEMKSWYETVKINNVLVKFKVDTGAQVNVLSVKEFKRLKAEPLIKTNVILEAFGGAKITPLGQVDLKCELNNVNETQKFIVVNNACSLLGLPTCIKLGLFKKDKLMAINECNSYYSKQQFVESNIGLFKGLGKFNEKCEIELKDNNCIPVMKPPRRIPLSLRGKVLKKLNDLEKLGIIKKAKGPIEWASNLVIVEKPDGSLRLCLDPVELNKVIKVEHCLIPKVEEICANLTGKKYFTVLDLKDGFYHVQLGDKSSKLCTFSTPFGYYQFRRLPFGLNLAPEFFQKVNYKNFGHIKGVSVYFDDLLIAGETEDEHDKILKEVINTAYKLNVKFNENKVQFKVREVKYLGHVFSEQGMKIDCERVRAINELKPPINKLELQKILGMINYFRGFVENFAKETVILRELLKNDIEFVWDRKHNEAFDKIKKLLTNAPVLANFNTNKQVVIQTDASKDGLGCCLSQDNRPVFFASRSLTEAEKRYSQIEKEFLAVAYACEKFHLFIYGRKIEIWTDHKPLVTIINKNLANISSPRLQRLQLKILRYDVSLKYVPGKYLHVADLLSRNYLNDKIEDDTEMLEVVHNVHSLTNITDEKIKTFQDHTANDAVLKQVCNFVQIGWPNKKTELSESLLPFYNLRSEVHVNNNILFVKDKIVVPDSLKQEMLKLVHESHFGIFKTKSRAKEYFYWPTMNKDIEKFIAKCKVCEKYRPENIKQPLIAHEMPGKPFEKVASDIFDYAGKSYLVIFDYFSKWLEVLPISNKSSIEVINKFKSCFSTHGIPSIVIADNVPYNSFSFHDFAKSYGFKLVTRSPNYPQSNGFAESGVKIAKMMLRKGCDLDVALLNYRDTPIQGINLSPSQILMNRKLNTKIPSPSSVLDKNTEQNEKVYKSLIEKQNKYKYYYDKRTKSRNEFSEGQNVTIRNNDKTWETGKVVGLANTPRSYLVQNETGNIVRRNSHHLRHSQNPYTTKNDVFVQNGDQVVNVEEPCVKGNNIQVEREKRTIKMPLRYNDYVMN